MILALAGNPNCGKTTLFNALTGANARTGNFPGVTVTRSESVCRARPEITLVDLPGVYALRPYSDEERVTRGYLLGGAADAVISIADATCPARSLYLTLQLLELGKPVVMALNMMDIVEKRGMEIDLHRLPEMLGIPVIPVSARKRRGLDVLLHAAIHHRDAKHTDPLIHEHKAVGAHMLDHKKYAMVYSDPIEDRIDKLIVALEEKYPGIVNPRWHAIKLLEQDQEILKKYPVQRNDLLDKNYETQIIREKYDFIEEIIHEVLLHKEASDKLTDRLDQVLTNKYWGIPVFLLIMAVVFFLTFTVGDWLKGYMEDAIDWLSEILKAAMAAGNVSEALQSLLIDGVLGGVGTIITFLPNILILFLTLGFLEDSGYMARVAYVMEDVMSKLGLSGKAFIPMLLGFGCTVPAIMASRALEHKRDRYKVMLITPFMSCNARLTIYILFAEMFFGSHAMVVAYSMYLIGLIVAILVALGLHGIEALKKKENEDYLLIELPEYKMPDMHTVGIYMWEKVESYLQKAGTVIFLGTIIIWFLLNFGPAGYTTEPTESFGAVIGHVLVPIFKPIGLGFWQICLALLAGISAKEVVVSSCAVLFGITNASSGAGMAAFAQDLEGIGFTSLNAICLMVFCLLYVPCAAALATIHKESGSWKWTGFEALFQLVTAWVVTFIFYHVLQLL